VAGGGVRGPGVKSAGDDDHTATGRWKAWTVPVRFAPHQMGSGRPLRSALRSGVVAAVSENPTNGGNPERSPGAPRARPFLHCVRNAGHVRRDRGEYTRVLSTFAHGAADASRVRRSARPLLRGRNVQHTPGAIAPRDRERVGEHPAV
jgi:hypothetical protein